VSNSRKFSKQGLTGEGGGKIKLKELNEQGGKDKPDSNGKGILPKNPQSDRKWKKETPMLERVPRRKKAQSQKRKNQKKNHVAQEKKNPSSKKSETGSAKYPGVWKDRLVAGESSRKSFALEEQTSKILGKRGLGKKVGKKKTSQIGRRCKRKRAEMIMGSVGRWGHTYLSAWGGGKKRCGGGTGRM